MKKIIDGKRYDTERAEEIVHWSNGCSRSDFGYVEESLYRTKSGNYFVAGCGGSLSNYASPCGTGGYSGGSDIQPLSKDAARVWLEDRGLTKTLEEFFAEDITDA